MSEDATRVLVVHLVDELDELERALWAEDALPPELRGRVGEVLRLACSVFDSLAESGIRKRASA